MVKDKKNKFNILNPIIGLCLLVTSRLGQIRDPWHSQAFNIKHIVIGLSLHIHSFTHLSSNSKTILQVKNEV